MADLNQFFFVVGLVSSIIMATMFPAEIGMKSFETIKAETTFNKLSAEDQTYFYQQGFFTKDGATTQNFTTLGELTSIGQNKDRFITTDTSFGFLDYIGVTFKLIGNLFKFLFAFFIMLSKLPNPFGFMLGTLGSLLYTYSFVRFIIGR